MANTSKKKDISKQVKDFSHAEQEKRTFIARQTFIGNLRTMSISILAITLAMVIDGIIIGQFLGTDAIAAYGLASPVFMILNAIFAVFGTGAQSVCANCMGRGDMKKANGIFNATLIATLSLSALMLIGLIVALDPLSQMLCATNSGDNSEALVQGTKDYILGITIGIPIQFLCRVISPFMQLDSDRERVLPSTLTGSCINIAGDLVNALFIGFGLFGMALASSIGFCGELTVLLFHFRKKTAMYKINFKLSSWKGWGNVVWVGLPTALGRVCGTLRTLFLNYQLLLIGGSVGVAALTVQQNSHNFFACVGTALGGTVLLMANLAYGEEDSTLLKQLLRLAIKAAIIAVGAVALILFIVAPWVSMLYSQDPEVLAMATTAIHFYAISMPIYALVQVVQNFCQATKKVTLAMFICVLDNFLLIILPAIILPNYFGINGIWMSFIACEILMILIYTVIVMIRKTSAKIKLDDFLLLTKEYDEMESNNFEYTIQDSEGVMMSSIGTEAFCMKNGIDDKRTNAVALCIEEMGANVVKNGIKENKKQYVDIKVIIRGDDIVIRLRDNCTDFNPVEHHKTNADDPFAGIGIKMVFKMAKDVNYIMTMNLNNLVITI